MQATYHCRRSAELNASLTTRLRSLLGTTISHARTEPWTEVHALDLAPGLSHVAPSSRRDRLSGHRLSNHSRPRRFDRCFQRARKRLDLYDPLADDSIKRMRSVGDSSCVGGRRPVMMPEPASIAGFRRFSGGLSRSHELRARFRRLGCFTLAVNQRGFRGSIGM